MTIPWIERAKACCHETRVRLFTRRLPLKPTSDIVWCGAHIGRMKTHTPYGRRSGRQHGGDACRPLMKATASPHALLDSTRIAKAASWLRSIEYGLLFCSEVVLKRLAQDLQDVTAKLRPCIQQQHPMVRQRHLPRQRHLAAPDPLHSGDCLMRARHGRVVTSVVRAPVTPATRWRHVVSRGSARRSAGRRVVGRRASIDLPAPAGPRRKIL
jgi:hypothetical protein